jgi:hypothetical protein
LFLVSADAAEQVLEVAGGVFPAERLRGLAVAAGEGEQGLGQRLQAGKVVRGNDFLLDDREEDLVG